jgi:hypothetical protein
VTLRYNCNHRLLRHARPFKLTRRLRLDDGDLIGLFSVRRRRIPRDTAVVRWKYVNGFRVKRWSCQHLANPFVRLRFHGKRRLKGRCTEDKDRMTRGDEPLVYIMFTLRGRMIQKSIACDDYPCGCTTDIYTTLRGVFRLTSRRWGATQIFSLIQAQNLQVHFLVIFISGESLIFVGFFFIKDPLGMVFCVVLF